MMKDRLKVQMDVAELAQIKEQLSTIALTLNQHLIALTPQERQNLPKMSDGTLPFVSKVLDYSITDSQFVPPYVDANEMYRDFKAVEDLTPLLREVEKLSNNLTDTITLAGSEAYVTALAFYNSVKLGAKLDVPNAKTVYEDLRVRFEKNNTAEEQ
jgi:hypothetical protein